MNLINRENGLFMLDRVNQTVRKIIKHWTINKSTDKHRKCAFFTNLKMPPYFLPNLVNSWCGLEPRKGKYPRIGRPLGPGGMLYFDLLKKVKIRNKRNTDSHKYACWIFSTVVRKSIVSVAQRTDHQFLIFD